MSLGAEAGDEGDLGVDFAGKQSVEDIMRAMTGFTSWLHFSVARCGDSIGNAFGNLFLA